MKLKDLGVKYDFTKVEEGKYETWVKEGYFTAGDISKTPYTIVIPPPNITGKLHIGHVLDTTLQDIIIRRKRMQGFDALYLPGMDHASIATQAKVEAELRTKGISRYDLGRDKFLEYCWAWKEKYGGIIHDQWKKVGISVDYTRERFTLDEGLNQAVNEVFVRMYNEGLIYRGEKIINWDIQSKTALSNIEVEYKDIEGAFYHFVYPFVDGEGGLEIATTRPETMFADTALMVHPEDDRYKEFVGKEVYIPGTNTKIPVITDEYVDREFGTGVVKVTPAHDPNDFEVGVRHNLPHPICMTDDGHMNEMAGKYEGLDRFECRKQVTKDLEEAGYCVKIEKMVHSVGHSERTGVVVEPRLSKQWFVSMKPLANMLIEFQKTEDKVIFIPQRFENTLLQWMYNIQDWCISRQLWWGHRIPAWYRENENGEEEIYVGKTAPAGKGWHQDEDSLDTWFSSGLWPFSTLGWPEETGDLARYFPTDTLVTGYDIIPFWVARMMFQSEYTTGKVPFKYCLIHGLIRDELGRKVSKSLGNGIDIYEAFDKYGVDTIRYFLTTSGTPGQDLRYSTEKIEAAWNYVNKIWNISRFIGINFDSFGYNGEKVNTSLLNNIDKWILLRLNETIKQADYNFEKFDFGEAAKAIYKFTWSDFASWYLEMTKVVFNGESSNEQKINTCAVLNEVLVAILKMLHPFMPFFTEEIYQMFNEGSITVANWPVVKEEYNFTEASKIDTIFDIITSVRNIRASKNVPNSKKVDLILEVKQEEVKKLIEDNLVYLMKFTNYDNITVTLDEVAKGLCVSNVCESVVVSIPLQALVNLEEEIAKANERKAQLEKEISRCEGMLSNPNFLAKAKEEKVNAEKEKLASYKGQLDDVLKLIKELSK